MSAQTTIVINDGASTPVARTFSPKGVKNVDGRTSKASWRENAGLFLAQPTIEEYHSAPAGPDSLEKFTWMIKVPRLQTVGTNDAGITPPANVAFTNWGKIEIGIHPSSTDEELSDIRAFVENFAATAMFETSIENRDATW